jgi:fucose 4-O-acetylase-like acetyltransferase
MDCKLSPGKNPGAASATTTDTVHSECTMTDKNQIAQEEVDRGRMTVLCGWFIAMLGIFLYCYLMLGCATPTEPGRSILEHGWLGSATLILLILGVLIWLHGVIIFFQAADLSKNNEDESTPSF